MLQGMRILVVEDEFVLAQELAAHFREAGATVLGPVSSIARAERYLDAADAAILDINLNGEVVFPLADELDKKGVPFVFFSGNDQIGLPERFRYAQTLSKPMGFRAASEILAAQSRADIDDDMLRLLQKLRLVARLHVGDPQAADRLVERTLEAALGKDSKGRRRPLGEWLNQLMEDVLRTDKMEIQN